MKNFSLYFHIARAQSVTLASIPAMLVTLVAVPLLEITLLWCAGIALTGVTSSSVAYASALVAFGSQIMTGIAMEITHDRSAGVLPYIVSQGLWHPKYWLSKTLVPAIGAFIPLFVSNVMITLATGQPWHMCMKIFFLAVIACMCAACMGIVASLLTLGSNDPYFVVNIFSAVLMLGSGVIIPLSQYPQPWGRIGAMLPLSGVVSAVRAESLTGPIIHEFIVILFWALLAFLVSGYMIRRWHNGKVAELAV